MARDIDERSRDILTFRPVIDFVEPDQEPEEPNPVEVPLDEPQAEDIAARKERIRKIAKAVEVLGAAVQARVDRRAKDVKIRLDPVVDAATIQALKRQFPEDDDEKPDKDYSISYDRYKICRDRIRVEGERVALNATVSEEEIARAREALDRNEANIGGFGTREATDGSLRPELEPKARIIEPIDIDEFQNLLIRILVNYIWRKFIKKRIPGGRFLPKRIAKIPKRFRNQIKDIEGFGVKVL